jgi:hypothetical protein
MGNQAGNQPDEHVTVGQGRDNNAGGKNAEPAKKGADKR